MSSSIARILRRPATVISGQAISQGRSAVAVCFSSKTPTQPLKGDEFLKNIFFDVKKKFEIAVRELKKEKITLDPDDPKAVSHYAQVMKNVREKAGLYSEADQIKNTVDDLTAGIPDARSYLEKLVEIRVKSGIEDHLGIEKMRMDALEKVEKQIKKPLMRDDKKSMQLLRAEFAAINKKLGISVEDLPKYEHQLEMKNAKEQLEYIKKNAMEAIEAQKKRDPKYADVVIDPRSLDIRNFL